MGAILPLATGRQIRHARFRHPEEATAATSGGCPRDRAHGGGDCHSDEGSGKRQSSRAGRPSRKSAETRTSTRPDHSFKAPPTHHPYLVREDGPAGVKRRGHYRTPQEGRPDGVRKLPRHLALVTRGQGAPQRGCRETLAVRQRGSYRRSSAVFDRIARPQT